MIDRGGDTFDQDAEGPRQVVSELLGAKTRMFTAGRRLVQPTADVRALRPWEEFDELISRWWIAISQAAVPGEFSGIVFSPNVAMPATTLWTIEWISANNINALVTIGATPGGFTGGPTKFADARAGTPVAGSGTQVDVAFGSDPATSGITLWVLQQAQTLIGPHLWPGYVSRGGGPNVGIWGGAVNTQLTVAAGGRIITRGR